MKSLHRTAVTSIMGLLLGILASTPVVSSEIAHADATITKTIVVRGADGNLLPNALVAVGYGDDAGWHFSDAVTTDSSGQAVLTGLPIKDWAELYVQPAIDDISNGIGFANSDPQSPYGVFNLDTSSSFNIRLLPATIRVNLKYSDGNPVKTHTSVYWPSDSTQSFWFQPNLIRQGAFGINLDNSLNCTNNGGNWQLQYAYWMDDTAGDNVDNQINLLASGCPSRTFALKDIITNDSYPKVGDVWQVSSRKTILKFKIVSPLDQTIIPRGSYLEICPVLVEGTSDYCFATGPQSGVGVPDGTYKLRANAGSISGFATTEFTAVVSNNGAATSLKVGYPASDTNVSFVDGRAVFELGVPNLSGSITKPNGETFTLTNNQGFSVQLLKDNGDGDYRYVSYIWSRGLYGFSLTQPGNYKIEVYPQGLPQYVTTRSPVITVTNSGGIKLSWNGAPATSNVSQNLALSIPNVTLNVLNPNTQDPMTFGWVTVENLNSIDQRIGWYGNLDISPQYPGVAAGKFADGKYLLTVNPPQGNQAVEGLASKQYVLIVSGSGTSLALHKGSSSSGELVSIGGDGRFTVTTGAANIVGRFLDSGGQGVGSSNFSWVNACLQRLMQDGVNWDWQTCSQTTASGAFSISVADPGTYRVVLEPQGRSDIATTILAQFVLTSENIANFKQDYGNVTAASPTLKIRIREVDGTSNIKNAGIEVRKDNQFITWVNTAQAGVVALNLPKAGVYQLIVNPTGSTPNSTRKVYTVTATEATNGAISASIDGVTPDGNGISTLFLGAAQIRGKVLMPTGDTAVANAWVVAVDKATNQEMWQYGSSSSQDGSFAISLPAGNYSIFAHAPNGDVTVGNSDPIGDVAIASDGTVTITGNAQTANLSASNFTIRMQNPFWTGRVLPPSGDVGVSNSRVCLNAVINGSQFWSCANTDIQGRWAMGKPAGFTDFGSNDQLQIAENQNPQYSMATYTGKTAIESAGFMHGGAAVDLRLPAPNFSVTIVYGANSTPASNLWVNINALMGGWIGGASTDVNGVARFRVSDLTKGVQIQVDPSNNSEVSAVAAATTKQYQDNQMASHVTGSNFADTITLAAPNIRGLVTDPSSNTKVANSWVELFDSNGIWLGGSNTNINGYFALNAPSSASYRVNVNPPWGGTTTATNHSYDVVVDGSGNVSTFTDKTSNAAISPTTYGTGAAYSLTLGTPSVIGRVIDPTTATVQNSWVVPITGANMQLWQLGSNSRGDGSFSMAIPDGSYKIQANAPWNSSSYSPSAGCSVTIANGVVTTTAGGCVQTDHKLILTLRAPNFSVIVRDSSGNPLQNAHVGLGLGSWNTNAQTDATGLASLFVDPAAINSVNNGKITGAQNMWLWIDPPYGNSTVVRSQCYSGQVGTACATLGQVTPGDGSFSNPQIVTNLAAPNTSVYVKLPNGSAAGANAWVSILSILKDGSGHQIGRNWIAGSNTDSDGKATFNLADTSLSFAIEIEAPWNQRDLYAGNSFDSNTAGLAFSEVNGRNFQLRTPNLTVNAKVSDGSSAISGGWISVETVNVSNNPTAWVGGYGLDQNGKVSLTLAANGRFKVTINPAPGVDGVATPCIVTTDGSAVVSAVTGGPTCALASTTLTVRLATGNVVGTVTGPNGVVVGAIISANIHGSADNSTLQVTSSDKNGTYNLQLDSAQVWDITVTPVNTPSDTLRLQSNVLSNRTIGAGINTVNVSLIAAS
jgi:hypothetical protein